MLLRSNFQLWRWRAIAARCSSLGLLSLLLGCVSDLPKAQLPSVTELPNDRDTLIVTTDINNQGPDPSRLAFYTADLQTGAVARWLLQNDVEIEQPNKNQALIENGPPVLLRDGSGLIYQGVFSGRSSPFLITPQGGVRSLTVPPAAQSSNGRRAWSADGRWLAYERIEPRGEATFSEIYLLDRQTGQQRLWLANDDADREIRWMSWSPDSQRLAVARYQLGQEAVDLTLLDLQKPPQVLIREGEATPFQVPEVAMYDFQWLPDSQRLSFLNHRSQTVRGNDDPLDEFLSFQWLFPQSSGVKSQSSIWILDIRTRQFQELPLVTQGERLGDLSAYTWSPDGQQLALVAGFAGPCRRLVTAGQITCSDHIYVASADGRRLRQLTQVEQWPSYRVLWFSPQRPAGPSF